MNSKTKFDRWNHVQWHTWPFQLFKQYNAELSNHIWAEYAAHKYVYKHLVKEVKIDTDDSRLYFSFPPKVWNLPTIEEWTKAYREEQMFLYLNCVIALNGNLETFLKAIISLAIESNPGVLIKASRSIDGVTLLKNSPLDQSIYSRKVEACTDGEWSKRRSAIEDLFGTSPEVLRDNIGELDSIRKMRNNVAHAFGRDIGASRDFSTLDKQPVARVSLDRLKKWLKITYDVAMAMDSFLLDHSIGEFQAILAYHNNKQKWPTRFQNERARDLKTYYGKMDQQVGLHFCNELIDYYEKL